MDKCASCGNPRDNHPYRHMFVPSKMSILSVPGDVDLREENETLIKKLEQAEADLAALGREDELTYQSAEIAWRMVAELRRKLEQAEAGLLVTYGQLKASREILAGYRDRGQRMSKEIARLRAVHKSYGIQRGRMRRQIRALKKRLKTPPPPQGPSNTYEREDGRG